MVLPIFSIGSFDSKVDMYPRANALIKLRYLIPGSNDCLSFSRGLVLKSHLFCTSGTCSTICLNDVENLVEESIGVTKECFEGFAKSSCGQSHSIALVEEHRGSSHNSVEVFKEWGCTDEDLSKLFLRTPSLRNALASQLQSKLRILSGLGLTAADLVKIINCRPRFLSSRINHCFDERIDYLTILFGSREMLRKAITRNPSLLTYDLHNKIKPVIALYEELGISKQDLIPMLISRPTLISRTSFDDEKFEYIRKSGVCKDAKMFKYVVAIVGISRLETLREKVANMEKFGFTDDDVWQLFGRSPLVLTLSIDKVQRNMTYIMGTIKLDASVVLSHPFLLFSNLEAVLKPRMLLAWKVQEMNLHPQIIGPLLIRALRMHEKRFLRAFVMCHPEKVAAELTEVYNKAKGIKRLAQSSKKFIFKGFPF